MKNPLTKLTDDSLILTSSMAQILLSCTDNTLSIPDTIMTLEDQVDKLQKVLVLLQNEVLRLVQTYQIYYKPAPTITVELSPLGLQLEMLDAILAAKSMDATFYKKYVKQLKDMSFATWIRTAEQELNLTTRFIEDETRNFKQYLKDIIFNKFDDLFMVALNSYTEKVNKQIKEKQANQKIIDEKDIAKALR